MRIHPIAFLYRVVLVLSLGLAALSGLAVAAVYPIVAIVPLGLVAYRRLMRFEGSDGAFGEARPSTLGELNARRQVGGGNGRDIIVGRAAYTGRPTHAEGLAALVNPAMDSDLACRLFFSGVLGSPLAGQSIVRIRDYVHGAVISPAGGGKGVGFLIPNALAYKNPVVINDPQGSIYAASARVRARRRRVVRLDVFRVMGEGGDGLNPLDFLPPPNAPDFLDACRDLANMLIFRQGTETEPFWNDSAERVLCVFILFIAAGERDPARRNLISVRRLLSSRKSYMATLAVMEKMPGIPPLVKQQGGTLSWLADRTLDGVLAVVHTQTAWMDGPATAAFLSRSTFDPMDLKKNKIDIFNILPPEKIETMASLSRVTFGTIIRTITRGKADERRPVLFLIDEAAAMGRLRVLENAVTQLRGYGIRMFFIYQSVNQVTSLYGNNAQTMLGNLNTQVWFGTNDYESCEYLSKLIGDCTVTLKTLNETRGYSHPTGTSAQPQGGSTNSSTSYNTSETGRRWAKPEEIRCFASDLALVFHKNQPVILCKLLKYFNAPEFRWGRTGKGRGLGLAGLVLTALVAAASLWLASAVTDALAPPRF
jgi:type IV secretion system protein VirD4